MSWYDTILTPLVWIVSWILWVAHWFLSLFLDPDSGAAWVLSIVLLVVLMRAAMIPLYVRQIKAARGMQLIQPELQKLQAKYKGKTDAISRQRQSEEMMSLYRKNGTSPFSSCLPILVQSPFFVALFRLLNNLTKIAAGTLPPVGPIGRKMAESVEGASLFGAPLSSSFMLAGKQQLAGDASPTVVRIVTIFLIVLMSVTVFTTQRQLTMKNMPDSAKDNPMFRAQKMMLYGYPVFFAISGVNFPIGVLIYWTTTNLWSMGQQFFVIRNNPAPGSEAEKVYLKREDEKLKRKAERTGRPYEELKAEFDAKKAEREAEEKAKRMKKGKSGPGLMGKITHAAGQAAQNQLAEQQQLQAQAQAHQQRVQPKRQSRSQRRGGAGGGAAGGTSEKTPPPQLQVKHGSGSGHGENAGSSGKPNGGNSGSAGGKPGASGAGGKSGKSGKK